MLTQEGFVFYNKTNNICLSCAKMLSFLFSLSLILLPTTLLIAKSWNDWLRRWVKVIHFKFYLDQWKGGVVEELLAREGEVFAFFLESPNQVYATMLRPEFRSMPTTKSFKNYTKNKKSGKKIKTVCYNLQLLVWKLKSGKLRHYKFNCKVKGKKGLDISQELKVYYC